MINSRVKLRIWSKVGLILALCIITCFLISLNWDLGYINTFGISIENGAICIIPSVPEEIFSLGGLSPGFSIDRVTSEVGWLTSLLFTDVYWWPKTSKIGDMRFIYLPLWIPLIISLIPFFVYQLKYKTQRGYCKQCNYDLKGNESGSCPECGSKITM